MPNISPAAVRESHYVDPRIVRSTHALGHALIELIQERDFDEITVQNILDRAGVGRATFYAHYRNKEDVLHSSYERLFELFEPHLARSATTRLFPVTEFLTHVGEARALVGALRKADQLDDTWSQFTGHAARIIARRMAALGIRTDVPDQLVARMLAAALMESIEWWIDRTTATTPAQIDAAFHELARGVLRTRTV